MSFDRAEFESLIYDWEAGVLDEAGVKKVREILRSSDEAKDFYVQHQALSAALYLESAGGTETEVTTTAEETLPKRRSAFQLKWWAAIAATALFIGLAGRLMYHEFSNDTPDVDSNRIASQEAMSSGIALVTRLVDVEFESDEAAVEVGDALSPGPLNIKSGFAQIEFFCGATLIVEGPAEIDLKSSSLARVSRGRLRAQVPPAARGFSLEVNDMKVVDLGTEFGLSVSSESADIQVFDGEVEVHSPQEDKRLLTAGEAVKRIAGGGFEPAKATPDQYVDIAAMANRIDGQRAARFESWKSFSEGFRSDPRVVAYYCFDSAGNWGRKLQSSIEPTNSELDGAIVGARRSEGRWPGKSGLEFKRPGDRVRVQIPGEFGSLTFACWARIDSLDRWYNSLFLTDGYNQANLTGRFSIQGNCSFRCGTKQMLLTERNLGPTHQEVLFATVLESIAEWALDSPCNDLRCKRGKITHFLNGNVLYEEKNRHEISGQKTKIGAASIGNWSIPIKPDAEYAVRNLNGSIDEFIIMSSALSADEIQEIYENGKP